MVGDLFGAAVREPKPKRKAQTARRLRDGHRGGKNEINERHETRTARALVDLIFSTSVTHHEGAVSSVLFSLVFAPGRQHRTGRQPRALSFEDSLETLSFQQERA